MSQLKPERLQQLLSNSPAGTRSRHKPSHKTRARGAQTMAGNSQGLRASFLTARVKKQTALDKWPPPGPPHKPCSSWRGSVASVLGVPAIESDHRFPGLSAGQVPLLTTKVPPASHPSSPFSCTKHNSSALLFLHAHWRNRFLARVF